MAKISKDLKQEHRIAEALATVIEARESVNSLALQYDQWIDQAAELGEDSYSDQLIAEQVDLELFSGDLKFIEVQIRKNAVSSRALGRLKALNTVIRACKTLNKGLDLQKTGKKLADLKSTLESSKTSLRDLRNELSGKDPYSDLFGKHTTKEDPKILSMIEAKKQAREARLVLKTTKTTENPVDSGVGKNVDASIDSITALIDEERKN